VPMFLAGWLGERAKGVGPRGNRSGAGLDPGVTRTYSVLSARATRWFQRVCRYLRRFPAQRCVPHFF
jgi:hypothetical protein